MIDSKHYRNAETVQSACNMSGVLIAFLDAVRDMRESGCDGDEINAHPVTRAYADKIASLANVQGDIGFDNAMEAHGIVMEYEPASC
jgi:hypothetical protein